jgi:putative Holliday junction resolvase
MPDTPENRPETIIALDFGLRRIGVAVGQQITNSATAIGVVANRDAGPDWVRLEAIIAEWQPARLVVGMPSHPDGSPSETAAMIRQFMTALARFGKPIESTDENYSSREAAVMLKDMRASGMRGRVSKEMIDSTAAMLIAERWLTRNR